MRGCRRSRPFESAPRPGAAGTGTAGGTPSAAVLDARLVGRWAAGPGARVCGAVLDVPPRLATGAAGIYSIHLSPTQYMRPSEWG